MGLARVNEKLINSQSEKEMNIFFRANLRIIAQETVFQRVLRMVAKR